MVTKLHELLHRQPFEPFRVSLSSGESYDVPHPEFAWLVKGGLYVGLPGKTQSEDLELPVKSVYCSLLHIAAVEVADGSRA
jgi:hypothetical protein